MKKYLLLFLFGIGSLSVGAQVKYLDRYEVIGQPFDPAFEIMEVEKGLVNFRTQVTRAFTGRRVFQFFVLNQAMESNGVIELSLRDGFDMVGYDTEGNQLYVLLAKGSTSNAEKYILHVDLDTNLGKEYDAKNLLASELVEFLVLERQAIFLGEAEGRPAIQILNLDYKTVQTVQGIYGNNTQVLQIKKLPELSSFEVVVSKKGQFKNKEVSLMTFDLTGNLVRDVKIQSFGEPGQEILEGILLSKENFEQAFIGAYGMVGRNSYEGVFWMDINEFGQYETKKYTLEDFPNFYNYLNEKQKIKADIYVQKQIEKGKKLSIRNTFSIRDVRESEDAYYLYFDQLKVISSRGNRNSRWMPGSYYRYDRWNRMGYDPNLLLLNPASSGATAMQIYTDYQYISAHLIKVAKTGQVLWDNAVSYDDFTTSYPMPFGEIALLGDEAYHMYVEEDDLVLSCIRGPEKVFERLKIELETPRENERIKTTDMGSIRLIYWYDRYFILTGKQTVRYQDENGREQNKEVYFVDKILVDANLYQLEENPD